jgi:hypothetical protein
VARTGTHDDVSMQLAFMDDLKAAAETALKTTTPGEGVNPSDRSSNPWAVLDDDIDRVAVACVNQLTARWSTRLAAYDVSSGASVSRWSRVFGLIESAARSIGQPSRIRACQ